MTAALSACLPVYLSVQVAFPCTASTKHLTPNQRLGSNLPEWNDLAASQALVFICNPELFFLLSLLIITLLTPRRVSPPIHHP